MQELHLDIFENLTGQTNEAFFESQVNSLLNETLKEWDLDYEVKKSLTNDESFILNIKKITKKN